jgi:hypothetical protein
VRTSAAQHTGQRGRGKRKHKTNTQTHKHTNTQTHKHTRIDRRLSPRRRTRRRGICAAPWSSRRSPVPLSAVVTTAGVRRDFYCGTSQRPRRCAVPPSWHGATLDRSAACALAQRDGERVRDGVACVQSANMRPAACRGPVYESRYKGTGPSRCQARGAPRDGQGGVYDLCCVPRQKEYHGAADNGKVVPAVLPRLSGNQSLESAPAPAQ